MCVSRNKAGILYKFVFFPLLGVVRLCDGFGQLILVRVSFALSAEHVKGEFYFLDFSPREPFGLGETLFCFVYKLSIAVRLAGDEVVWFVSPLSVEDFKFDSFIFR